MTCSIGSSTTERGFSRAILRKRRDLLRVGGEIISPQPAGDFGAWMERIGAPARLLR
jgi:hypothetical protein